MPTAPSSILSFCGIVAWGDLNGLTVYRNKRGKVVVFPKTYPAKPPSDDQLEQRAKFTCAAADWQNLTDDERRDWDLITRRCSLCMHGYDLWVSYHLCPDPNAIATLERQSGIDLTLPLTPSSSG